MNLIWDIGPKMKTHWQIQNPDPGSVQSLSTALNCSSIMASILVNRNISTAESATRFLNGSVSQLGSPFSMKDMDAAVQRIVRAISDRERILIFGDYDTDGVTATVLLLDFIGSAGGDVIYYIPHRTREGYSLQATHIEQIASPKGATLIITVDCGSAGHTAIASANDAGIDVIVTDHHIVPANLPPAIAVINPKRPDCPAGFEDLSGVGVAFYLIIALRKQMRDLGFWNDQSEPNLKRSCDLVALGTVADIVPLSNDNRILTRWGLEEINSSCRPGIKALIQASGIADRRVDADDIAFRLAPRLNAAGRMDHADIAVRLLMEKDPIAAAEIAARLNDLNGQRQKAERRLLDQILSDIQICPELLGKYSLVLSGEKWPAGILGIVASRLTRRFHRPVILISTKESQGKGSGRSIPGFDLYQGLSACSEEIESFGGHQMAAGLALKVTQIDRFKKIFDATVKEMTTPDDFVPRILVDYELDLENVPNSLIDELESLKPFGSGNPEPVFMTRNVMISSSKIVGKSHRKMRIRSALRPGLRQFDTIQFNVDPKQQLTDNCEQILFRLGWNYWNGRKSAQITIEDM